MIYIIFWILDHVGEAEKEAVDKLAKRALKQRDNDFLGIMFGRTEAKSVICFGNKGGDLVLDLEIIEVVLKVRFSLFKSKIRIYRTQQNTLYREHL